ncbi:MAG: cytochrome c [Capsulimonadales bacterium]|nr:cytochrome c [Capsulimonadales bacterium]
MLLRLLEAAPGAMLLLVFLMPSVSARQETPVFGRDVAPILKSACVSCHAPGRVGPFPLLTYGDAYRRARQLVQVTQSGYMPPWQAATPGFCGERHLSATDRDTIKRWADAGAPEGERIAPLSAGPSSPWPLGTPDRVLTMARPYVVPPNTLEATRCFVLPALGKAARLRAIAFRPSNPAAIRYVSLYADPTGQGRRQETLSGAVGYFGFTAGLSPSPAGTLADWSPGGVTMALPPGFAYRLTPKTDLILQVRFHPTGKAESERMQVGLYFSKDPSPLEPVILRLGKAPLYLPRQSTAVLTDSFTLPTAVRLMEIVPNAHFVARTVTVTAALPDGKTLSLLDIPDWDANWKQAYRLPSPLSLPAGTRLSLRITFNNTEENPRNPWTPSHRVVPGLEFMEEMSSVWLRLLPTTPAARAILTRSLPSARHQPIIDIDEREPDGPKPAPRPGPPVSDPPAKGR